MPSQAQSIYHTLRIKDIIPEANGVKTFILEPQLPYKAGQFLTFVIHHHNKEERRSFSISSSPDANEPLAITVKRIDNGVYSRLLTDRAHIGDELITTGAGGLFTLPENVNDYRQVFFFAAGIGITPIFSLIKTILYTCPQLPVTLVYSNRNVNEVVFYNQLNDLVNKFPGRFHVEYLFSNSFNLARARLNKELLPVLLQELSNAPVSTTLFYTCGPYSYMRMVIYALQEQGIPAANIKKENFNTELKPVFKPEPPDKTAHTVFIKTKNKLFSFTSQYPDTILQAAKKNNIQLPYSCETGRCGSCTAICTKGKVWMSNNEVLTNADLEKGHILTCVGYPISSDIELAIN